MPSIEISGSGPHRLERHALQSGSSSRIGGGVGGSSNEGSEAALPRRVVLLGQDPGFKERLICGGSRCPAWGLGTAPYLAKSLLDSALFGGCRGLFWAEPP